ncbi:hypothetical protein HX891_13830 [Pseudomonas reactans]|uniref:hypothetical protein n=1 Tax=Pseudomonas reactans TaxID=117680 RepID=UPI0015B9D1B8|nr:hypothetical protein [Pseudomonas reactans]NWD81458.1 hypothetical protein [Pseudomonas reactans]
MKFSDLTKWLGHSPEEPEFDIFLRSNRIYDRPCEEDEDHIETLIDEVERASITLIYEERTEYEKIFESPYGTGKYVLKQIAFYSKSMHDYPGFKGELPFNLSFEDTRIDTHCKLGLPSASRKVHGLLCDLYLLEDFHVNLSYKDKNENIGIIHIRHQHLYDKLRLRKTILEKNSRTADIESLIQCLGSNPINGAIAKALEPTEWQPSKSTSSLHEITELIVPNGLTLYFDPIENSKQTPPPPTPFESTFTGFRINRKGDMKSKGFNGPLPLGIEFYDTPEDVLRKLGRDPDEHWIGDDIGFFKWQLQTYVLHIMFSLIDYQVYRVSCFSKTTEILKTY